MEGKISFKWKKSSDGCSWVGSRFVHHAATGAIVLDDSWRPHRAVDGHYLSLKGEDKQDIRVVTRVSFLKKTLLHQEEMFMDVELPEGNHDEHLTPGRLFGGFTA